MAQLAGCDKPLDAVVERLAYGCPDLEEVTLARCEGLGKAAVRTLVEQCRRLVLLDLSEARRAVGDDEMEVGEQTGGVG